MHRITDARRSREDDQRDRMIKYSVAMTVRMVCLVLAFVVTGPLRWVFIAGAVILPYVAVLIANASREQALPPPAAWDVAPPALSPGEQPRDPQ